LAREAFRTAHRDTTATAGLIDWLQRAGEEAHRDELRDRARRERDLQIGLSRRSSRVDLERWTTALAGAADPEPVAAPQDRDRLDRELDAVAAERDRRPDAQLDVEAAWLTLRYAEATRLAGGDPTFLFDDAIALARRAIDAGTEDPRAPAIAASGSYQIGEVETALEFAASALPRLPEQAGTRLAYDVVALVAREGSRAIYDAMAEDRPIPVERVTETRAAQEVLFRHPAATESQLADGLDWLDVVGGWGLEGELVRIALRRFPNSPAIHERFRGQLLRDAGAAALETAYAGLELPDADPPTLLWFRGFAAFVAGDRHLEDGRDDDARSAYARSAAAFGAAIEARPDFEASTRAWLDAALERSTR
jgi:hypothetical protein